METMEYKGYKAKLEIDKKNKTFVGTVIGIGDVVSFEAESFDEMEIEFKKSIDEYLEVCEAVGKEPDKVFRGQFNVRVSSEVHRDLYMIAEEKNEPLNSVVKEALCKYIAEYD